MEDGKRKEVGLMRYRTIAPLISGTYDLGPRTVFYRKVCADGVKTPDGEIRHYAPSTIKQWYRDYLAGGIDALFPKGRCDMGQPRKLDPDLRAQIRYLKTTYPRMTAASIHRHLQEMGLISAGQVSLSTVSRYCHTLEQERQDEKGGLKDMRRYECEHVNEVWYGDTTFGPWLRVNGKKRRACIIALIDDASRFITGIDVFFNDNFVNVMSVMKSAVAKYGRPKLFSFDNGSSYRNLQMELVVARIGSAVNYCEPYTPTSKAKIERWFRTLKDQWLARLDMADFHCLSGLRESLMAYVQSYQRQSHRSLNNSSPQDRYFSEPEHFHHLTENEVFKGFLLEIKRKVSADHVIVIDGVQFEVPPHFVNRHIQLRYTPDLKEFFAVEANNALTPIRLLNKQDNAKARRERIRISEGDN